MGVINIFMTGSLGDALHDFVHDDLRFTFGRIDAEGPRRLIEGPVWVFIDWVMEDMAGLELCRRLRADPRTAEAHITMVLEKDDPEDRRRALRAGADDYAVGPLDRTALLDRVMALQSARLANASALLDRHTGAVLEQGELTINIPAYQARWAGEPVDLSPNEFRLLRFFAENPDRLLTRRELIEGLGKSEPPIDERTVDVWIGRLRRALKAAGAVDPIRTVRAMGYV
ncbi:MAG: response regulator transcription factor, partial [Erythrobacter sp.]